MDYHNFVGRRIPLDVRNKDNVTFNFLHSFVKQNAIRTTHQLENHVVAEIDAYRKWLAKNKTCSTMNKLRRDTVHKLNYLVKVKGLIDNHLK